jgi:methylglyoxal synthase
LPHDFAREAEHQLGAQIAQNDIDLMIFLREPIAQRYVEPDINSIMRLCGAHNIPLASNLATAEVLLLALDRGDLDWRNIVK